MQTMSKSTTAAALAEWQAGQLSKTNVPPTRPSPTNAPPTPLATLHPPSEATTNHAIEPTWISLRRWSAAHNGEPPRLLAKTPLPSYAVLAGGKAFGLQVGSRVASCNNVELQLGFAPQLMDHEVWLHRLDLKKNLEPLIEPASPVASNRVVVLDPGHGGINAGARNVASGGWEKEYTLDWARRLVPLLEERGWRVFLTRSNDVDLSLGDRVTVAEAHNASLFVSLHFNSSAESGHEQPGLETLCLTPTGMPSNLTRDFSDNPAEVFLNNAFDAENIRWAMRLHAALLQADGMADRGVRRARFPGVLRTQKRAAVLIEGGFLSNPAEARRIASPEHRQKLAEALARAFGERLEVRGQKPEVRSEPIEETETNAAAQPPARLERVPPP